VSGFGIGIPTDVPIALPQTLVMGVDITSALRTLVPIPSTLLVGVSATKFTLVA
jgi:hypothetical protein